MDQMPDLINMMCLYNTGFMGTYNYRGTWNTLDHILISHHLLQEQSFLYCYEDQPVIYHPTYLMEEDGDSPLRTFNYRNEVVGYSDHLPVIGYFRFQE